MHLRLRSRPLDGIAGRLLAIIGAIGVVFAALTAFPTAATAAPNGNVVLGEATLENDDGGQVTIGDVLTFSGTWDASAAGPQAGDTFYIGLPDELGFEQAVPFDLSGPASDGTQQTWATCLTDPASGIAECTFTDAVTQYPEEVRGEFSFQVWAEQATTENEVIFDLNGSDTPVVVPGGGGIDDGIVVPEDWDKRGVLNSDKWSMTWSIDLPGAALQGHDVVNVFEDLSDNHQLCDPSGLKVETVRGSTVVDVTEIASINNDVASPYDFAFVLTQPDAGFDPSVTYRITYTTCTPDNEIDPQGTEYTNEAVVDIWGNDSSGVIGVTQDWAFTGDVEKWGGVLGGAERNGEVEWHVTVAGDFLEGKRSFNFSEALSGEHEVCEETISGIQIYERYGPAGGWNNITDELSVAENSASAQAFDLDISIRDGSDFTFKPSDHLYTLEYYTCATTDGLPAAGTTFTNEANVDGSIATSEPSVPGRTDEKRGNINSSSVTLDGVEYLPQTTIDWAIQVPGERLADIDGPLTVTDEITGAHQVCEANGGPLVDRLGLKVEARDQINNGGLATVDLTDSVTASVEGETLTLSIAEPTLPLPDGTEASGFSHEYEYVVSYTTCTTSGGMDAPGTSYANSATVAGKTYTHTSTQNNSGSGSGAGTTRGSVAISKDIADTPGAAFLPADAMFTVHVKEIDPSGTTQIEYDLQVPANGDPVSGPNSRGHGWTIELSEPTFPSVPGVTFGAPIFAASPGVTPSADGTTAIAALVPGNNVAVSLVNSAQLGSLTVEKVIEGPAASQVDPNREFTMMAQIDTSALGADFPAQPDRTFTVTAAEPHVLTDLPIGAVVTVTETQPADDDTFTWSTPVVSPESVEIEAGHVAAPAVVTVTNTVERTLGTFTISKDVTGEQAANPVVPGEITVTATWNQEGTPGEKVLTIPTDGTPVAFGEDLLVGTQVTLVETPLEDGSRIAWGAPVWSGTGVELSGQDAVVTVGRDADAAVTVENHAATSTAGISLLKGVGGEAAGEVLEGTEFPVTATWVDADGVEQSEELMINATEPVGLSVDLPAGTVITLTEGERPAFDTVVWDSITISGDNVTDLGDGSAQIVVSDQQDDVTLVTITNEATWAPGTFSVAKDVVGVPLEDPEMPESVTVIATWNDEAGDEQSQELTVATDGTVTTFEGDLPHGTEVTLTEVAAADTDRFTWGAPTWGGEGVTTTDQEGATFTIGAANETLVSLTNTATETLGSIELVKGLTGDGAASAAGTVFPVTLAWTDLHGEVQEREIEVTAGEATIVDDVPMGVEIEIVEGEADLADNLRWIGVEWSSDDEGVTLEADGQTAVVTVVGEAGGNVTLTLTNEIEAQPDGLAVSGGEASFTWVVIGGALLLLAGASVLFVRHRRMS